MNWRKVLACVVPALFVAHAEAATRVQSGDHIGFVRLVVYYDRGQEWSLEQTETGYRLAAPGLDDGYDVSRVFELIQRDRIAGVSSSDEALVIELACKCEATTTELSTGQLVIDFSDPSPIELSVAGQAIEPVVPESLPDATIEDPTSDENPVQSPTIDLPTNQNAPSLDLDTLSTDESSSEPTEQLAEFRRRLLENLGRSASLSLIDLTEPNEDANELGERVARQISIGEEQRDRTRISNAVDNALDASPRKPQAEQRATCPNQALFQIGDWGSEEGFAEQIASIRRNILGEFDEVDTAQVRDLARTYLHYGLTDEARHVFTQFDGAAEDRNMAHVLSRLIDGRSKHETSELAPYDHCGGSIVPWRLLDMPKTASISEEQKQTIAAEFSKWPKSLQKSIGPRLMDILKMRGFDTTASFINAIIGDGRPAIDPETSGTSAPIASIKEGVEQGDPEALAILLRRSMDDRMQIEDRLLDLASAFEREAAGTPLSDLLHDLRVEAHSYRGEVPQLIDTMEKGLGNRDYSPTVVAAATGHVLDTAPTEQIVVFGSFLMRSDLINLVPGELVFQIAEKIVGLGLPNLANEVLASRSELELPVPLAASLAQSERQIARLADLLPGISDDAERDRRANEVLNLAAANRLPDTIFEDLTSSTRDRIAWAQSDWENVGSDGPEGRISELIVDLGEIELADTPLTIAKDIRDKAAETRELLSQIFGETIQ